MRSSLRARAGIAAAVLASAVLVLVPAVSAVAVAPSPDPAPPVVLPSAISGPLATSYPLADRLAVQPAAVGTDAAARRGLVPYSELAPRLNAIADQSDRVSLQVVGTSTLGRPLYLVTVTSPETTEETAAQTAMRDALTADPASLAADPSLLDGYKMPLWFNSGVHGTEMEGVDASLELIAELAESTDPAVEQLLDETRLYFTIANNPDGRTLDQRNTVGSVGDPGNGLDANRDGITDATSEAAMQRDVAAAIRPLMYSDYHGYMGVLTVEPCTPPHNPDLDYALFIPHAYASALAVEQAVVAAQIPNNPTPGDRIQIPYRDFEGGWDDYPPIFGPQAAALAGAVSAQTVELAVPSFPDLDGVDGLSLAQRTRANIDTAKVTMRAFADYAVSNRAGLLETQVAFFDRAVAGEPIQAIAPDGTSAGLLPDAPTQWQEFWDSGDSISVSLPRGYVIPLGTGQRSDSDARTLVQLLRSHRVQVDQLAVDTEIEGTTYPAGSFTVDMHQPYRSWANTLLADGLDITPGGVALYDPFAGWSAGRLWGATVAAFGSTADDGFPATVPASTEAAPTVGGVAGDYLTVPLTGLAEYRAVNELVARGVAVSVVGAVAVLGTDAETRAAAIDVSSRYGVSFSASDGQFLRGADQRALAAPRIAYLTPDWSPEQDDQIALAKLGFRDTVRYTESQLNDGTAQLDDVDIVYVAWTLGLTDEGVAAVQRFLDRGGNVVAVNWELGDVLARWNVLPVRVVTGTGGSSGILATTAGEGALLAGTEQGAAFAVGASWFADLGAGVVVEQRYDAADPLIAGYWPEAPDQGQSAAAGQPSVVSGTTPGGGRAVLFGTQPTYRAHTVGGFEQFGAAMLSLSPAGTPLPVPAAPTTPPTTDPSSGATADPTSSPVAGAASAGGDLAITGSDMSIAVVWWGVAALLIGATVVIVQRTRGRRALRTTKDDGATD